MTPSIALFSGGPGIGYISPIFIDSGLRGYIVGNVPLNEKDNFRQSPLFAEFGVQFVDTNGAVIGEQLNTDAVDQQLVQTSQFEVLGQTWTVNVWPRPDAAAAMRSGNSRITILVGLFTLAFIILSAVLARVAYAGRAEANAMSARLAYTIENMSDSFVEVDKDWRIVYANHQATQLLKMDLATMVGRRTADVFPEFGPERRAKLGAAISKNETARFELDWADGACWLDVTIYPTQYGFSVYFTDITAERKRTEQLRLLQTAIFRLNDMVIIADADQHDAPAGPPVIFVNEAFTKKTGYAPEEIIGKPLSILDGPKTDRKELDRIKSALLNWETVKAELVSYRKDGSQYWVELETVPVADETGRYTHWVSVDRDITARKEAEDRLARSEERFRLVAEATDDVIWDWDPATNTVWCNDLIRTNFGYDPVLDADAINHWYDLIHPDDYHAFVTKRRKQMIDPTVETTVESYRLVRKNGTFAHVVENAKVIRNEKGEPIRAVGTLVDETEKRKLEQSLQQSQRLEAVGQLTGGIAHDFNNILTVILGNAELCATGALAREKEVALANSTIDAALHGADLIGRLLAFARQQPLQPKIVDVALIFDEITPLLKRAINANITISVDTAPGLWPIEVDAAQVKSALLNLGLNARDAMPHGGTITVSAANEVVSRQTAATISEAEPGEYVVISVADSGTGMSPEVLSRALEPFFTTKAPGKGSGLGLSTIFGFVRQSNGFVRIQSELGQGTVVQLYFPRTSKDHDEAEMLKDDVAIVGGAETVLVVEDNEAVLAHSISRLNRLGYNCLQAASADEAWDVLKSDTPIDLLFTDIVMPGSMGGRELAELAVSAQPDLKVLYTSGHSYSALIQDGRLEAGIILLTKPYRIAEMAEKIRQALDT